MAPRALLVGLAALAPLPALARIFRGSTTTDYWPFIAKFAYGSDKSGAPVGTYAFSYNYIGPVAGQVQAGMYLYDDAQWAASYPGACAAAIPNANAGSLTPLDPSVSSLGPLPVVEPAAPHYWFFTAATVAPPCGSPVALAWTLTLKQANGSHLSYDEIGLPAAYGVFWAASLALLAAHVWAHYLRPEKLRPAIVRWVTGSLACVGASWFCRLVDIASVERNGEGPGGPFFSVAADVFRLASLMALWVAAALAANGVGVVSRGLVERNLNWVGYLLLVALLLGYVTLAVYAAIDVDPRVVVSFGSLWPATTLLLVTLAYAGWWAWKTRATVLAETSTVKRRVLVNLALALAGNFFILPFVLLVSSVTPAYERLRIVNGLDLALVFGLYSAVVWALWPARAADAFKSFGEASSYAGMLGLDDGASDAAMLAGGAGGGGGGDATLAAAYAYAEAGEDSTATKGFAV